MATGTMVFNGRKSIPISAMTPELWSSVFGNPEAQAGTPAALYQSVPWLYAGVNLIAAAVGSLPVQWLNAQGEAIESVQEVAWALEFGDLLNAVAGDLLIYGAAYVFRANNVRGRPVQLRRLLPTTITPKYDSTDGLTHFVRALDGKEQRLALKDVVYIWEPNRAGEIGPGTSRVQAVLKAAGALGNIDSAAEIMFRNGAIRPTIVAFEGLAQDAERERVQGWLDRAVAGIRNAFRPLAVGTVITPTTLGDPPGDLAMPALTDSKRQDVATALGVPQTLLFSNAANYATAQQDTLNFYDLTVVPLARRILAAFNGQCFQALGLTVETAEGELELYQTLQGEQVDALGAMFAHGVITVNEFRERVGFPPIDDPALDELDSGQDEEPAPAATPEAPEEDADDMPEFEGDAAARERDEMRAWARFVGKRLKAGKALRPFEARYIDPAVKAAIDAELEGLQDAQRAAAIFAHAERFIGYP